MTWVFHRPYITRTPEEAVEPNRLLKHNMYALADSPPTITATTDARDFLIASPFESPPRQLQYSLNTDQTPTGAPYPHGSCGPPPPKPPSDTRPDIIEPHVPSRLEMTIQGAVPTASRDTPMHYNMDELLTSPAKLAATEEKKDREIILSPSPPAPPPVVKPYLCCHDGCVSTAQPGLELCQEHINEIIQVPSVVYRYGTCLNRGCFNTRRGLAFFCTEHAALSFTLVDDPARSRSRSTPVPPTLETTEFKATENEPLHEAIEDKSPGRFLRDRQTRSEVPFARIKPRDPKNVFQCDPKLDGQGSKFLDVTLPDGTLQRVYEGSPDHIMHMIAASLIALASDHTDKRVLSPPVEQKAADLPVPVPCHADGCKLTTYRTYCHDHSCVVRLPSWCETRACPGLAFCFDHLQAEAKSQHSTFWECVVYECCRHRAENSLFCQNHAATPMPDTVVFVKPEVPVRSIELISATCESVLKLTDCFNIHHPQEDKSILSLPFLQDSDGRPFRLVPQPDGTTKKVYDSSTEEMD